MELESFRDSRLVSADEFNKMSAEGETIILDTRSKSAFDRIHVKGAVHLNFSDFTKQKLKEVIPNKETRILIYCNNNFDSPNLAMANKSFDLALNIPTFINLHGYGYENIYELEDYIKEEDSKIKLEKQKAY